MGLGLQTAASGPSPFFLRSFHGLSHRAGVVASFAHFDDGFPKPFDLGNPLHSEPLKIAR